MLAARTVEAPLTVRVVQAFAQVSLQFGHPQGTFAVDLALAGLLLHRRAHRRRAGLLAGHLGRLRLRLDLRLGRLRLGFDLRLGLDDGQLGLWRFDYLGNGLRFRLGHGLRRCRLWRGDQRLQFGMLTGELAVLVHVGGGVFLIQ